MPATTKMLLPIDFSARACPAVRYVLPFAEHFHSELTLLHVVAPHVELGGIEMTGMVLQDAIEQWHAQAQRNLDEFLAAELAHLRVTRVMLDGDPARKIIEFAHSERCDLICMPTHGYGPFRRLLLGSVTAKVLHDAQCPVWTGVHMEEAPDRHSAPLRHVACAVDLGGHSPAVLGWASWIASQFESRLTLIHVLTGLNPMTEGYQLSPEWRRECMESAEAEIAGLQEKLGTMAEVSLRTGNLTESVCTDARRLGADLLVIGRSANGIVGRLTDHAYAIIRESPCPVVSV